MAVGSFPAGASPYGCLDMSGNVWEWCLNVYKSYPYRDDGRNDPNAGGNRVLRGGGWIWNQSSARVSYRNFNLPDYFYGSNGFRVLVAPVF